MIHTNGVTALEYSRSLPGWIAKGIELAAKNLAPAKVGWGVAHDPEHVHCRRWILRPDRLDAVTTCWGTHDSRSHYHPGYQNPNFEGRIDEVAIYDRALNSEEVARYYALASPLD